MLEGGRNRPAEVMRGLLVAWQPAYFGEFIVCIKLLAGKEGVPIAVLPMEAA